jgi:uncharacterized protein YbjT (DUF2867 family)
MSKLLVVFAATGQQGGSAIDFVLNDPILSKEFKMRGLTRNTTSPASQALQKRGVETVQCDVDDHDSVKKAVSGAHTVFVVTVSSTLPSRPPSFKILTITQSMTAKMSTTK